MKKLAVVCELVPGDRLPSDTWRVTLELDGEWLMYREWSCGLNGEHKVKARREAYDLAGRLLEALEQ